MASKKAPLFSVIMPTYNRWTYLTRAIDSVLAQSFQDFELIIVDDGSSDETVANMSSLKDPRIKYFWQKNSGGPASPRNSGIKVASGTWVCLLDADDWWLPNKLESIVKYAHGDKYDFIHHELSIDGAVYRKLINWFKAVFSNHNNQHFKSLIFKGNYISTSSVSMRKNVVNKVGRFNESPSMASCEDYNYWLRFSLATNKIKFINKILGGYQTHENNISSRNIILPLKKALLEFNNLKKPENLDVKVMLRYTIAKQHFLKKDPICIKYYVYCLYNGSAYFKLRSIYMIIYSYMNINCKNN
jgi:glycosyltransferase involved in cell wall biosynthesis